MAKLELVNVDIDTQKTYSPMDKFVFKLTFSNQDKLDDDVEFEVLYFGDAYSDDHDQKICHNIIGPLEAGKMYFELETNQIDLTKVPIKTLFGLTTLLIVGKFRGAQFIRIGFVVDVRYPGIEAEKFADTEKDSDEGDEEIDQEESDDEDVEVDDEEDDDIEVDDEESDDIEVDDEESDDIEVDDEKDGDIEADDEEDDDITDDEEQTGYENDGEVELHDAIAEAIFPTKKHRYVPLETPITADKDEFEYKGYSMNKKKIQMILLEKPIVHVFDIDWDAKKQNEAMSSDSDFEDGAAANVVKKAKTE